MQFHQSMETNNLTIQPATSDDLPILEEIRIKAFQPVFQSFRKILGDKIYETAQLAEDLAQKEILKSYFDKESVWETWTVIFDSQIVGFIAINHDDKSKVGEIGLNAVDPDFSRKGIGTEAYKFAVSEMKKKGMKVATVATGGDPSHLPARKAYRKAGFDVEISSVWMCQDLDRY